MTRWHPYKFPRPPQLAPLNLRKQRHCFKVPPDLLPLPWRVGPAGVQGDLISATCTGRPCSFCHYPQLMAATENRDADRNHRHRRQACRRDSPLREAGLHSKLLRCCAMYEHPNTPHSCSASYRMQMYHIHTYSTCRLLAYSHKSSYNCIDEKCWSTVPMPVPSQNVQWSTGFNWAESTLQCSGISLSREPVKHDLQACQT